MTNKNENSNNTAVQSSDKARKALRLQHMEMRKSGETDLNFKDWLESQQIETKDVASTVQAAIESSAPKLGNEKMDVSKIPQPTSKMESARQIFREELQQSIQLRKPISRKHILERFRQEVDMTIDTANTYYQSLRKDAGLVQPRT
ncbi:MAG: hypothetical protein ACXWFB_05950 [Nitrososphaeraceae archaeon]